MILTPRKVSKIKTFDSDATWSVEGIENGTFAIASNKKKLRALKKSDADVVYYETKGKLYLNENGEQKGWGNKKWGIGGLIAKFRRHTKLNKGHFDGFIDHNNHEATDDHLFHTGSLGGSDYTISAFNSPLVEEKTFDNIKLSYQKVVEKYASLFSWEGTMDFAVIFEKNSYKEEGGRFGALSWNYAAPNTLSALNEQSTGMDLNGGDGRPSTQDEADLGFYMDVDDAGLINNYFSPVWFPEEYNNSQDQFENMPSGHVDGMSIMTHELYHSMGVSTTAGFFSEDGKLEDSYYVNEFTRLIDASQEPWKFTGTKTKLIHGSELPLDNGVPDHFALDNLIGEPLKTINSRGGNYDMSWRDLTDLDIAVLQDIGWTTVQL